MRLRVIAVGTRMPRWVGEVFDEYATRLPSTLKLTLAEVKDSEKLLAAVRKDDFVVALDEHGDEFTTRELASWLKVRMQDGRDLAFLIGGADGHPPDALARAQLKLSLSRLTLPHMLVRVVIAEQLYRAHTVLTNHPYHRE